MKETTNYKLKKIELSDSPPDITVINPNWDLIDDNLKETSDRAILNEEKVDELAKPNLLYNSDFQIWQDGKEFIGANGSYTADGWKRYNGVDNNVKVYQTNGIVPGYKSAIRIEAYENVGGIDSYTLISQLLETTDKLKCNNNKIVFSAKFNADNGVTGVYLRFSDGNNHYDSNVVQGDGTTKKLEMKIDLAGKTLGDVSCTIVVNRSNLSIGKGVTIQWVKLELGEKATPHYSKPFDEELRKCQRYYEISYPYGTIPRTNNSKGSMPWVDTIIGTVIGGFQFKVPKASIPTVKIYSELGTINKVTKINGDDVGVNVLCDVISENGIRQLIDTSEPFSGTEKYTYHWVADARI